MKSRITFLSILSVMMAFAASAQNVEQDDMYFRSKDRAVLAATKPLTYANTVSRASEVNSPINPTDSYSARNVNPEYISQNKINPSSTQPGAVTYFIPNYTPTAVNQNIYNNTANWNYYGAGYRPSYYGMNSMMGYGMNSMMGYGMMSGFGSPYYNSFYSPYSSFGSPYSYYDPFGYNSFGYNGYNSFYGNPYSSRLSFTMGMGFGYGGFNNYYGNSFYNNFWGGGYNPYYGNNVIIVSGDANGSNVSYGKRSSRSNDLNNAVNTGGRSVSSTSSQTASRSSSNGRVADSNNAGSYYQRGWRSNPETNTRSSWGNAANTSNANSWNNNNSRSSSNSSFFNNSNTRSSSNWSGGNSNVSSGAGRSSGGSVSSGSSSSGGSSSSRGRH
jgi:hypothetical protein